MERPINTKGLLLKGSNVSKKIRNSARGEDCSLRISPMCNDGETVVLCHIGKNRGIGIKCSDYFAIYACNHCHDILDGRTTESEPDYNIEEEKLRALEETQGKLFNKGLLVIK